MQKMFIRYKSDKPSSLTDLYSAPGYPGASGGFIPKKLHLARLRYTLHLQNSVH